MQNKRVLMIVGGVLGLAALCCVGVVIFGYVYNEGSENSSRTRNIAVLKDVCAGETVAETAVYDPNNSGTHPAAIVQHVGGNEYIFASTGWPYHPNNVEETELVVCLEDPQEVVMETCEYTLEGDAGEATITRVSLVSEYRLITTNTGEVVDEGTVKAVPRECQDEETFENNAGFSLRGDYGEVLEGLLMQHLETP